MSPEPALPAACARFLDGLADWASGAARPDAEHVRGCGSCADRVRAARCTATLLKTLAAPELPAELAAPQFLERIHEAITAASAASSYGEALEASITPKAMPLDPGWEGAALAATPRSSPPLALLAAKAAPGWLWARIRSDLRAGLVERRSLRRRSFAMRTVAAALLIAGIGIALWANHRAGAGPGGTKSPMSPVGVDDIVFVTVDTPFATDASPSLLLRDLGRSPTSG